MKAALPLIVALALLAPAAVAHVESFNQSQALTAGPFLVFFEPRPIPPFVDDAASMVIQVSDSDTGARISRIPITVIVAGPNDFAERKTLESDGTGYFVAAMRFPSAGNYSTRILLKDERTNETHGVDTEFEVFPDLPVRIRPVDLEADAIVGTRTILAFDVIDPDTLSRKDALDDLSVKIERWSDDHREFLGETTVPAQKISPGLWRLEHTFQATGMHHLRFASQGGGFTYADVPLLHVYAITAEEAGIQPEETPVPIVVAIAAIAIAGILLRRR